MKRLLSTLVCLLFVNAQVFALSGGPGGGSAEVNLTGSYAGTMIPVFDPTTSTGALLQLDQNAIGLFGIKVEDVGMAEGVVAIFNKGEVFTGKSIGIGDPDKGTLQLVFEARTVRVVTVVVAGAVGGGFQIGTVIAVGRIDAKVKTASGPTGRTRIKGTALVNSFDDAARDPVTGLPILTGFVSLKLSGYKQSDTPEDYPDIDLGVDIQR